MKRQVQSPMKTPTFDESLAEIKAELEQIHLSDTEFRKSMVTLVEEYHKEVIRLRDIILQIERETIQRQENAKKQFKSE